MLKLTNAILDINLNSILASRVSIPSAVVILEIFRSFWVIYISQNLIFTTWAVVPTEESRGHHD